AVGTECHRRDPAGVVSWSWAAPDEGGTPRPKNEFLRFMPLGGGREEQHRVLLRESRVLLRAADALETQCLGRRQPRPRQVLLLRQRLRSFQECLAPFVPLHIY